MIVRMEAYSAQLSAPELQLGPSDMAGGDPVVVRDIQGLGPVKAEFASTPLATGRGEIPQGSSVGKRNIVLTLGLNPNWQDQTIASLRQLLYAYFMPQAWCKMRFYSHDLPPVDIEGFVETMEPNIFSQDPELEISILNHKPDFIDADATVIEGVITNNLIDFVFNYAGTVDTGFELTIKATPARPSYVGGFDFVLKPTGGTPQTFTVTPNVTIDGTKYLKLTTIPAGNRRSLENIAVADGTATNLMAKVATASVWPMIQPGENLFQIFVADNLQLGQKFSFAYFNRYGGL